MTGSQLLTAFLDANALCAAELRNLLMRLAPADAYRPRWSDQVQQEWTDALARDRPDLPRARINRVRALMEAHVPGAAVTGYEPMIDQLTLPDPKAAAITAGAGIIVTANLKHFPAPALAPHGIEAVHPDEFILRLFNHAPGRVVATAREHRLSLSRQPSRSQTISSASRPPASPVRRRRSGRSSSCSSDAQPRQARIM